MDEKKEKLSIEEQLNQVSAGQTPKEKKESSIEDEISKALGSLRFDDDILVDEKLKLQDGAEPEDTPAEPEENEEPEEIEIPDEERDKTPETDTMSEKQVSKKKVKKQKEKNKKSNAKKAIGIAAAVLLVAIGVAYGVGVYYYSSHFYRRTVINGFDFSNKTAEEVQEKLTEEVDTYVLTLQERENVTETISGKTIDMRLTFDNDFTKMVKEQSAFAWPKCLFAKSSYEVGSAVSYNERKLEGVIDLLKACDEVTMITPVDASVEWNEGEKKYVINPGVVGTKLNKETFVAAVGNAVHTIQKSLNLEEANCYLLQNITEKDERLVKAAEELNRAATAVITYNINGTQEVCDGSVIHTWLSLDENYQMQINAEMARAYIDTLGEKYNTYNTTRSFTAHDGSTISITKGDYGWRMNRADTTEELIAAVRAGGSQQKEILWLQTANAVGPKDWGSTYVEVDITNQHVYFYKNGELIVETDCVTGKMTNDRMTPPGIYSLKYKEKDRILRGQRRSDGSYEYESHVNFWMPFNGGVGMHDASWRSSYGGSIYINSGSHGCVNLPYSKAKAIYENIETGTPVICYYRSTPSVRKVEPEPVVTEPEPQPQLEATPEPVVPEPEPADPNTGQETDPNAGQSADPNADQTADPNADQMSDPNAGQTADPTAVVPEPESGQGE